MPLQHPTVAPIARRIQEDAPHRLALCLMADDQNCFMAVVKAESGTIVAWDSVGLRAEEPTNLAEIDWADWDDWPSKKIARANAQWLSQLVDYLLPSYSFAQLAAEFIIDWAGKSDAPPSPLAPLVAYFPVVDTDVCASTLDAKLRHLNEVRGRAMDSGWPEARTILEALRA